MYVFACFSQQIKASRVFTSPIKGSFGLEQFACSVLAVPRAAQRTREELNLLKLSRGLMMQRYEEVGT